MKRKMIIGLLALGLTAGVGTTALANGNGFDFPNMHNNQMQNGFGMMNWTDHEYNMGYMFDNHGDYEEMEDYMNRVHPNWEHENMNTEWFNNMDDYMNGTPFQGEGFEQMYNTCHGNN